VSSIQRCINTDAIESLNVDGSTIQKYYKDSKGHPTNGAQNYLAQKSIPHRKWPAESIKYFLK